MPTTDVLAPKTTPRTTGLRFDRHRGPVTGVAAIPGRAAAISVGYDSAVGWVDLEHGSLELMGWHDHLVNAVSVRADGALAATSSSDYTIRLWDLATRREVRVLRGHADDVNGFVFLDGDHGASVSHDQKVYVWDLATGAVLKILEGHEKYAMSIDAAGGSIYSSGDDMTLRRWDGETGALLATWGPFEVETDSCAIDGRRARIVLGADDGRVRVFDVATGAPVGEIAAHASGVKKVAVSPTTGAILSAAYDQRLRVWDAESFELAVELERCATVWERSLAFSPDGAQILGGTFDGTVVVWDAASGRRLAEIGARSRGEGNVCFNEVAADGRGGAVAVSDDGYVRLLALAPERAEVLARVEPISGRVLMNAVACDDELRRVAAGAHDQKLHLFRRQGDVLAGEIEVDLAEGPINTVRFARHRGFEGDVFVGCYSGTTVRVSREGEIRARFRLNHGAVKALALHPREPLGVSCSADGGAVAWSFEGAVLQRFPGHVAIADDVDLDPAGERVATVSRDFTLKVYELRSGRLLAVRSLGQKSPKSICFWERDTVLVGNYWGDLFRFDLASGKVAKARIAENGLSALARAGEHVAASSYDGAIYLVRPADLAVVNVLRLMVQKVKQPKESV